ncbi:amino acid ABC transporter ATP-binding protein [Dehalobacterium formicoaceticum]|uniref:amino acid ABC transporter ATP-binding protein n=1 Tax=Dehalobacterium formicoaceticum TaxID=51515 RepID=UPI000B7DBCC7|nr:amino acid ABC transporter ATP-binding protein [Dehalobacterium formicoaceticum]
MSMIRMSNIHKYFGDLHVLKGVSLEVKKGEIVSIIGPSGSGKSTFLRCMNQLEKIDKGVVEIEGMVVEAAGDVTEKVTASPKDVRATYRKMGMVFQNFNLFPHMTVLGNVIEAPMTVNKTDKVAAIEIAEQQLAKVGLLDKIDAYPSKLSGGQRQRVAIARALAMKPEIMLFDEPTSALDPELVGEVLEVIKKLAADHMTMLVVTHEMSFARELSHRIVFMDEGEIIEECPPQQFFEAPSHARVKLFLEKML